MKKIVSAVAVAVAVPVIGAVAWCVCPNCDKKDVGAKTADAMTDTTKAALRGTADVAKTSVTDTIAAPRTAIEAVENTASTAVTKADAALKALTGEDSQ